MSFEITDEQLSLRLAVNDLLDVRSNARASYDGGTPLDRDLWAGLANMGVLALSAPGSIGGPDGSFMDEVLTAECLGASAAAVPVVGIALLGHLLGTIGGTPAKAILAEALSGERVVLAAVSASLGLDLSFMAASDGGSWSISGQIDDLLEGAGADAYLLPATVEGELAWFLVNVGDPGVEANDQPSLDQGQRLGRLVCRQATATYVGSCPDGDRTEYSRALVLLAAQAVGAAGRALDISVAYAKDRRQFGQPIGRFQAIKHTLAEMLIDVENARSATYNAAWALDEARDDRELAVTMAKAVATENAVRVIHHAIQVHGGIGYTWEHDLHLLLRRAKTASVVLGSPDTHFDVLGAQLFEGKIKRSANGKRGVSSKDTAALSSVIDAAGDRAFLDEFSEWLDANLPEGWGTPNFRLPRDPSERRAFLVELQRSMAEGNWVGIHWPKEFGGRDATLAQQITYHAELVRRGIPPFPGHRGITIVGPSLIRHGTPDQQRRFIDRIRRGDDLWAGGFSEPGAGSDLASLRTRGVIEGDSVRVNGQKVWTSSAQWCNWIYTLVRTNPDAPKHQGISVVLIPLDSPGITVRPIRQITGSAEFNEIFFDDVVVPVGNILGPVDGGWAVNRTTLSHEHFTLFIGAQARHARSVDSLIDGVLRRGEGESRLPSLRVRNRLARQWAISQLLLINGLRNVARVQAGGEPGPEGSIMKVFGQESEKALFELAFDLVGPRAVLDRGAENAPDRGKWLFGYLSSRAATIGGGTSEIHLNKIGENVLGLPRDIAADDD
jgi:alkylation response protein AidB-like acyl-CoA dehydrogenase